MTLADSYNRRLRKVHVTHLRVEIFLTICTLAVALFAARAVDISHKAQKEIWRYENANGMCLSDEAKGYVGRTVEDNRILFLQCITDVMDMNK